jgi:hypothetical protein
MFSRKSCYFFVRPKQKYLEVCVFLGRAVQSPRVRRTQPVSKTKTVHVIHITHRDEVEEPVTGWLREAWEFCNEKAGSARAAAAPPKKPGRGKADS